MSLFVFGECEISSRIAEGLKVEIVDSPLVKSGKLYIIYTESAIKELSTIDKTHKYVEYLKFIYLENKCIPIYSIFHGNIMTLRDIHSSDYFMNHLFMLLKYAPFIPSTYSFHPDMFDQKIIPPPEKRKSLEYTEIGDIEYRYYIIGLNEKDNECVNKYLNPEWKSHENSRCIYVMDHTYPYGTRELRKFNEMTIPENSICVVLNHDHDYPPDGEEYRARGHRSAVKKMLENFRNIIVANKHVEWYKLLRNTLGK